MIFKICWVKKSKAYRKSSILKTYTSKCLYMHKTFPEGNEKLLAIFDYRKGIDIWDKMEFSSVQFSCSVMSDSLRPHELQHARPPCLSPTPRVHSNSFHRVSDAIQPSHPLSSPLLLPPIPPSIRVFSNESTLHMRWPKYWSTTRWRLETTS